MDKHLIYIPLIVALFFSCAPEESKISNLGVCNCDDLQLDELYNHFFIEDRKEPYTGECFKLNKKSDTIETINYKNGKVDGTLTKYFESGKIHSESNFRHNKFHGDYFEWNENEELIFHGLYNNGIFDTILVDLR